MAASSNVDGGSLAASSNEESRSISPPPLDLKRSLRRTKSSIGNRDPFIELQAILTGLPMHAVGKTSRCTVCCCASTNGGCFCCCYPGEIEKLPWVLPCHEQVEIALLHATHTYPGFKGELQRLQVVHASYDLTIFVDTEGQRMFTSIRGTNCCTCRDLSNDALVFFGCWLCRTRWAREEYVHVRKQFPTYRSYGCGHSLGGTVMTELAHTLEEDEQLAFDRVDVFNTGGSPMARAFTGLKVTQFNDHRVAGDYISKYFGVEEGPGETYEHSPRPGVWSHSLVHFLPETSEAFTSFFDNCCTLRRYHTDPLPAENPSAQANPNEAMDETKDPAASLN